MVGFRMIQVFGGFIIVVDVGKKVRGGRTNQ